MTNRQERKRVSPHPLLYVLTTLVALNLVVTAWIALHYVKTTAPGAAAAQKPLPAAVEQLRDRFAGQLIEAYNRRDFASIYELFDPYAQAESSETLVAESIGRWREVLGRITSFSYSHHQAFGRQVDRDWYDLFYRANFSGQKTKIGMLKIRVAGNGDSFGIMRIDVIAD
jgi:hypothetical protein